MEKVIPRRKTLSVEEFNKIHQLSSEGLSQRQIAEKVDRAPSSVCYALNNVKMSKLIEREAREKAKVYQCKNELQAIDEEDFSSKPDEVLFQHTREYIF